MPTPLYADVHVPGPVILQLRLRGVDIAAAIEEGHRQKTDEELLIISTSMGRVMVIQDIRFRARAGIGNALGAPSQASFSPTNDA